MNFSSEILSAGWYKGKNFWSVNLGIRGDISGSIPKDMFTFMREMKGLDVTNIDWQNYKASVSKESLTVSSYAEVGLGFSRAINDRLTVGGRAKLLLGIGRLDLNVNNISISTTLNGVSSNMDWSNITLEQLAAIYGTASIDVDATLESSFKGLNYVNGDNGYINDVDLVESDLGVAGYGFGIDLGASYKVTDKLTVSASVLDLGMMSWSKDCTVIASANTSDLSFNSNVSGDIERFADIVGSGSVLNYDMLCLETTNAEESRTSSLAASVVVGADYKFLNDKLSVGALYTGRFAPTQTINEVTLSGNYFVNNLLNFSLSYSMNQSAGKTFGFGMKLGYLFLGTDYMYLGESSQSISGFVGLSVPLGKKKQ